MNLDLIKNNTKWEDAANSINSNFNKTNLELTKIAASSVKHKGYFTTEAALLAAQPSPKVGDNAYVGATYPGVVYICNTAGIWTATTTVPSPPAVDIAEYYKKTETDTLVNGVSGEVDTLRADLKQFGKNFTAQAKPGLIRTITIGQQIGQVEPVLSYQYVKINVMSGEKYKIKAKGGSEPKSWALTDNNQILLSNDMNSNVIFDGIVDVLQDGYLIVNNIINDCELNVELIDSYIEKSYNFSNKIAEEYLSLYDQDVVSIKDIQWDDYIISNSESKYVQYSDYKSGLIDVRNYSKIIIESNNTHPTEIALLNEAPLVGNVVDFSMGLTILDISKKYEFDTNNSKYLYIANVNGVRGIPSYLIGQKKIKPPVYVNLNNVQKDNRVINSSNIYIETPSIYYSVLIDITGYNSIDIDTPQNGVVEYSLLKELPIVGEKIAYADKHSKTISLQPNTHFQMTTSDARYLYFAVVDGQIVLPKKVVLNYLSINKPIKSNRYILIAASDSSYEDKMLADYVCSGVNDQDVINKAILFLPKGGTIQLLDGNYYIDAFNYTITSGIKAAIYFPFTQYGAVITIKGTTENHGYLSHHGVILHVTENAYNTLDDVTIYDVIGGALQKPTEDGNGDGIHGDIGTYTFPTNLNVENLYIYLFSTRKKIIGIDGRWFGSMSLNLVGVYHKDFFRARFDWGKQDPPIRLESAVEGCIGVWSNRMSNDEMARIEMNFVNVGGLFEGFVLNGVDHLVMKSCFAVMCCYGYTFKGYAGKTLTMINCSDEGNRHLPRFIGQGQLSNIDFNIESIKNATPLYPDYDIYSYYSTEDLQGTIGWNGYISFTGSNKMFENGHGRNFIIINQEHSHQGTTPPTIADFGEEYFHTTLNKKLFYNGTNWVDSLGNVL